MYGRWPNHKCIIPEVVLSREDLSGYPDWNYMTSTYYPVLAGLVAQFCPETVLEIGTRYGYSLAVMMGASPTVRRVLSFDVNELPGGRYMYGGAPGVYEGTKRLFQALQADGRYWPHVSVLSFNEIDTQSVDKLPHFPWEVDFAYIDGDHSVKGALHDADLVLPMMARRCVIVADDAEYHGGEIGRALANWGAERDFNHVELADTWGKRRLVLTRGYGTRVQEAQSGPVPTEKPNGGGDGDGERQE